MLERLLRPLALDDFRLAPGADNLEFNTTDRCCFHDAVELRVQGGAVHFPDCLGQIAAKHLVDQHQLGIHFRQIALPGRPRPQSYGHQGEEQAKAQGGDHQTTTKRAGLSLQGRSAFRVGQVGVHFSHLAAMLS